MWIENKKNIYLVLCKKTLFWFLNLNRNDILNFIKEFTTFSNSSNHFRYRNI